MYFPNFDSQSEKLPKFDILFFTLFKSVYPGTSNATLFNNCGNTRGKKVCNFSHSTVLILNILAGFVCVIL